MFKLHRHKSDRLGERFEFKFSNFRALQVVRSFPFFFVQCVTVDLDLDIWNLFELFDSCGNLAFLVGHLR